MMGFKDNNITALTLKKKEKDYKKRKRLSIISVPVLIGTVSHKG